MKRIRNHSLLLLVLVTVLFGCGEKPFFEKVFSFDERVWTLEQRPEFNLEVTDTTALYDISLTLRTTTDYKFNNLWIFLKTTLPDGQSERLPFQIRISNEDGSWIGNKTGSVVETSLDFPARKLPMKGEYSFIVEQAVTQSKIDEVLDIGLRVNKSDQP
jgi:gliding motility-associated lipoprotein GldH